MHHDIIVIGGSAGAVEPLVHITGRLEKGMPAAVFAVIHIAATSKGELAEIINRASGMECAIAEDGEPIRHGRIYLAKPDFHLLVESNRVVVVRGPKENRVRPSIDPLFRSAAAAFGPRVIGVVLSGMLDDGAQGLAAIKSAGGLAIVQDPSEARFPSMPINACLAVQPDHQARIEEIPDLLKRLVPTLVHAVGVPGPRLADEARVSANQLMSEEAMRELGAPSVFTCPDCDGGLFEIKDSRMVRFRCPIGHAYGAHSLMAGKDSVIEVALSASLRAMQESQRLSRQLLASLGEREFPQTRRELQAKADSMHRNAQVIQNLLTQFENASEFGLSTN